MLYTYTSIASFFVLQISIPLNREQVFQPIRYVRALLRGPIDRQEAKPKGCFTMTLIDCIKAEQSPVRCLCDSILVAEAVR